MEDPTMRWFYPLLLLVGLGLLSGCSVSRKLSKVGIRDPASNLGDPHEISALRAGLVASKEFAPLCNKAWVHRVQVAALEKIDLPKCGPAFDEAASLSDPYLKIEERSLIEQVRESQCNTIARSQLDLPLQQFLDGFESSGPIGRIVISQGASDSAPAITELKKLHDSIATLLLINLPIERRIISGGEYLLAESELRVLNEIIVKRSCSLGDSNLEEVYQSISSLEDLESILKSDSQLQDLQEVLQGLHKIVDNKITEYFSAK